MFTLPARVSELKGLVYNEVCFGWREATQLYGCVTHGGEGFMGDFACEKKRLCNISYKHCLRQPKYVPLRDCKCRAV